MVYIIGLFSLYFLLVLVCFIYITNDEYKINYIKYINNIMGIKINEIVVILFISFIAPIIFPILLIKEAVNKINSIKK